MIRINALFFLLLVELLAIFAGLLVFLFFREKKLLAVFHESRKELDNAHAAKEELRKQVTSLKAGAARHPAATEGTAERIHQAPKAESKDHETDKREIAVLEEKLKEKTRLLADLQAKFDSVEKEYLLLYQQQQQAQEMNKS